MPSWTAFPGSGASEAGVSGNGQVSQISLCAVHSSGGDRLPVVHPERRFQALQLARQEDTSEDKWPEISIRRMSNFIF